MDGLHQNWNAITQRAPMPSLPSYQAQGPVPQVAYPRSNTPGGSPDGTGGPETFMQSVMSRLAEAEAYRQQRMTPLQGMFGGNADNLYQSPVDIQYVQPGITGQQRAFDDLSRWLAQQQQHPTPNMRPYINPNFGRAQDWQNQLIDF